MSTRALVTLFALPLLALTACSREKSDWHSAEAADSSESYEQFVAEHPDSQLVVKARERLAQLGEEKDWRTAALADTRDAYESFLSLHPSGKWVAEARQRLENFANGSAPAGATPDGGAVAPANASATPADAAGSAVPADAPLGMDAVAAGEYGIQLGAFSSAERANTEWKKIEGDARGLLDGLAPRVVVGEANSKPIYRLQSHVRDEVQARAVCGGLVQAKHACVVLHPRASP